MRVAPGNPQRFSDGRLVPVLLDLGSIFIYFFGVVLCLLFLLVVGVFAREWFRRGRNAAKPAAQRTYVMPTSNWLPDDASDATIIAAVDRWAALLEAEQYDAAFNATGHDPARARTPDLMRQAITQYDEAEPGQKVTLEGKPTDITQRKRVRRFAKNKHGIVGEVWYD